MKIITCTYERHAEAILAILNEAIKNSTAIYDYQPRQISTMSSWFAAKSAGNFPVIGIESDCQKLLGFASYGTFRAWPAYKYTVEHCVYVHKNYQQQGLGSQLMAELIKIATAQEQHVLIGGIDATNQASIALHQKLGFVHAGTIAQAGFKFGKWLDLAFYQLILKTPTSPTDG